MQEEHKVAEREKKENKDEDELQLFQPPSSAPLSLSEMLVLLMAGPILVPIRSISIFHVNNVFEVSSCRSALLVLVALFAWFVSGLGLMFKDKQAFDSKPQVHCISQCCQICLFINMITRVVGGACAGS